MTDLIIQPKFETLATQLNSKGEECYDEHTIAEALGIQFSDLRKITGRLEKANEIHGEDFICTVKAGFTTREVESRLFNLDDTKLIVTQSGGKHAVAFCRYLIQRDKKLDQTTLLINGMMADETICRRVLQLADEKQNALIAERDHALKTKGQISRSREASVMAKYGSLLRAHEKLKAQIGVQDEEVEQDEDKNEQNITEVIKRVLSNPVDSTVWLKIQQKTCRSVEQDPPIGFISFWTFALSVKKVRLNFRGWAIAEIARVMSETEEMVLVMRKNQYNKSYATPHFTREAFEKYFLQNDLWGFLKSKNPHLTQVGYPEVPGNLFHKPKSEIPLIPVEF